MDHRRFFLALAISLCAACSSGSPDGSSSSGGGSTNSATSSGAGGAGGGSVDVSSTTGGIGDTCTGGDNMTNPRIEGMVTQGSVGAEVLIVWDAGTGPGATLPASYFDAPKIEGPDAAAIAQAQHSGPQEITITFSDLAKTLANQSTIAFTLVFPDRRDFSGCSHPGMDDRYLLDVTLTFDQSGQIMDSKLEQKVVLGDI